MTKPIEDDAVVVHRLLVELLVHQFAFPVQWINTQETLLAGEDGVSRLVELGPSKILTAMAKKAAQHLVTDSSRPADLYTAFLASTQDESELRYEYNDQLALEGVPDPPSTEGSHSIVPAQEVQKAISVPSPSMPVASTDVQYDPLQPEEIVRAQVARKLKRPLEQVSIQKSVKDLCNGKSTVQNELIGDFYSEFGSLPDRPEDRSLKELATLALAGREVKLGPVSNTLLSKMVSSKMPARSNLESIRQHLLSKWGLTVLDQASILLYALTTEPASRLASVAAAEEYWDQMVIKCGEISGRTFQIQQTPAVEAVASYAATDPALLAGAFKSQTVMASKHMHALAEYLNVEISGSSSPGVEAQVSKLQGRLDAWAEEMSETFLDGTNSRFDARKGRLYNSWWNIAKAELMEIRYGSSLDRLAIRKSEFEAAVDRLSNRACPDLQTMLLDGRTRGRHSLDTSSTHAAILAQIQEAVRKGIQQPPMARLRLIPRKPQTIVGSDGSIEYTEIWRTPTSGPTAYVDHLERFIQERTERGSQVVCLKSPKAGSFVTDDGLTRLFLKTLLDALSNGISLEGRKVLITGAGPGSIGAELARLLLMAGAHIVLTTSREPSVAARFFQDMYEECGSRGSELILLPFNQASARDCERLIDHIYTDLDWDLDALLPFAAAPEASTEIDSISGHNELVHRSMLVNVVRLLGRTITNKRSRGIDCHPTQVLLPLSPNHGTFGGDGLYPESKMGLEALLNRVRSEGWSRELSVCGVEIGWTRSTGLMTGNDIVAEAIEDHGVLTFSAEEMALNIVALLTQDVVERCEEGPVVADFSGGLNALEDCHSIMSAARRGLNATVEVKKAIKAQDAREQQMLGSNTPQPLPTGTRAKPMLQVGYPRLPAYAAEIRPLQGLAEATDPAELTVVVGFAELGPMGSARIRWEIESRGALGKTGSVEMAWLMGLIRHFDGPRGEGYYVGWVDAETNEPVHPADIGNKYGAHMTKHSGIRLVEPSVNGFDPTNKEYLEEIAIEEDLPDFEASIEAAEAFKRRHGDKVVIIDFENSDRCRVRLKRGTSLMIPKSVPFTWGSVAGQLPTGWSPAKYGIPEDLVQTLDPVALVTLCCVAEAFFSAGMPDPVEAFKWIHLSELGNFVGSSMGGALKTRHLYKDTYLDKSVASDALQDTYLNTTSAWVNMLLLGATGPIKTPAGACATAIESVDSGLESIALGKTKMCIVGGYDDLQEDESYGFSRMKATVNAADEMSRGRLPSEMSRPTAASRAGFVESQGCGIQILCRGDIAIEMGLPIYAVLAGSTMASDKIGRSVPAPGQGILGFAKESIAPPLLNISAEPLTPVRHRSTDSSGKSSTHTSVFDSESQASVSSPNSTLGAQTPAYDSTPTKPSVRSKSIFGQSTISPMRAALHRIGLDIDDIDIASLHGTSTKKNDINEPEVLCKQMDHLGRSPVRPMWAICQKSVTGHPKAAAAAWMINGCLQILDTGIVPGNRNADNVDPELQRFKHLCFPTKPVRTDRSSVKAFLVSSFGFGQKGGQLVGAAPRYFFSLLDEQGFEAYSKRFHHRTSLGDRAYAKAVMANNIVRVRSESPYEESDMTEIFLDPLTRASDDSATGSYRYKSNDLRNTTRRPPVSETAGFAEEVTPDAIRMGVADDWSHVQIEDEIQKTLHAIGGTATVGVDIVVLSTFDAAENPVFLERNYTFQEREYAKRARSLPRAYASRWCAKEAVFKCLGARSKGSGAAMKEIEIGSEEGIPTVVLHGDALAAAQIAKLSNIRVSISYGDDCVIAVAIGTEQVC